MSKSLADYYVWQEPEREITICLHQQTVDRLQLDILKAIHASVKTRPETSGILLGKTELEGGRRIIIIEDFEPVLSQHRHGSSYSFSAQDRLDFQAAVARSKDRVNHPLSIAGYYRSHNRDGLYLSADDLSLIEAHFREPRAVFMVIKTLPMDGCTAGFFFREHGHIQSEFPYLEVPFGPIESVPAIPPPYVPAKRTLAG